ncbi:MAG: hypothetical protein L3J36_07065 [Rhodobacteraceae bacterium]|nr:hypothetical protein [Paracoccaceae bacterium]
MFNARIARSRFIRFDTAQPITRLEYRSRTTARYHQAAKGRTPAPIKRSFTALIASYKRSHRFSKLASRTRRDYDKCLLFFDGKMGKLDPAKMQRRHVIQMQMDNAKNGALGELPRAGGARVV